MKNFYEVLGVSPSSEPEVIAAAYKAMMRKYHPDTNKSPSAEKKFTDINEAYEVLKNAVSRREHDVDLEQDDTSIASSLLSSASNSQESEPESLNKKSPFLGKQGEIRIWVIFAVAYAAIALIYYGPFWIAVALESGRVGFWAEVAAAAFVPFSLGFVGMMFCRAVSSSDPKTNRIRWLLIQFVFIAVLVYSRVAENM
ncbi:J domain-containing protein [Sphingorhabdus sp. EL138]|uniref:J domain-containing protein n=1 Tax=Sphingorhabdus sp. EL138 TaxID=2073156 RepID=UPI0025D11DE8|nr:J domain-containing protein [Sphingorhabdus sp. EL138]